MNFVKKVVEGEVDESIHNQFIRFGKGEYAGRFLLTLRKGKKIKIKSSFEFANDFVLLCSGFGACEVSGIVLSKKDISEIMSVNKIEGHSETKKGGLYYLNNIEKQKLQGEQLRVLEKESYSSLLDLEGDDFKLKVKKKLPKPGKSEGKIDDGFCQLEADEKYYSKIKNDFFWDAPEAKKIQATHKVIVNEIVMPAGEKDYAKIRELSKRKGKLIRKLNVEGKEIIKEFDFEA